MGILLGSLYLRILKNGKQLQKMVKIFCGNIFANLNENDQRFTELKVNERN